MVKSRRCPNRECRLQQEARAAHMARRPDFGVVREGSVGVDMKRANACMKETLGINEDEVVQSLLNAMYAKAPRFRGASHPTVTELLPTVLQSLKPLE